MDAHKINQNSEARSQSEIVKVVKLKRFMPKMDASHIFKRLICFNRDNDAPTPNDCTENVDCKTEVLEDAIIKEEVPENEIDVPNNFEDCSSSFETWLIDIRKGKKINKGCSHTTEELTKLTEHYDDTLVEVGNIYESREAFRKYINDNAKRWSYYYVCRTSKKNILEYNCICMAYKLKPKEKVIRRQKKRTTACPCKIRLTVDQDTKEVIVYYVCNHHDHELTESAFYHYPHAKYLSQEVKDVFLDLAYLGLEIDLIQKYIHSLVGLTIKRKDIASYAYKFKRKTIQRNLTVERRQYIKDLIATIRGDYKETMDVALKQNSEEDSPVALGIKSSKSEQCKRRKSQSNSKDGKNNSLDTTIDDDVNNKFKESGDNIFDNLPDSNVDLNNYDVIVQYINDEGILCDQNGTPVTNSSTIMQFITNHEHVLAVNENKDGFLEEGAVFSELVENISDVIYPLDWEIEELDKDNVTSIDTTEYVAADVNMEVATTDCELDPDQDMNSNNMPRITILSDISVNCDKRLSPTPASPAVYADMDNFKKYYFVDHRYIKYESENSYSLKQRATKETQINRCYNPKCLNMTKEAVENCEEYIKAPDFEYLPAPLRKCLGHNDLTMLSDADVILPGAKFLTHQVFLKYINERASRWFFYYSLVESGKKPEFYVYKCVFGKHRASKNAYRAKGLRKRAKLTTQCPCQIRLRRLYSDSTYLTVLYSCNHHDHVLDAQLFKAQPHSRRLPEHIKEEIKDLLFLGAKFDLLRKYVTSETGLRIYDKYFHNVRVKMTKDDEERQFTEERFAALTQKLKDLEAAYGSASKENPQFRTVQGQAEKRRLSSRDTSQPGTSRKHGRLETRLKNLSSHEETLLKVKKLQESVRSDNVRNTLEVVVTVQRHGQGL